VREALDRLTPLATESVSAAFQQTMSHAVERELNDSPLGPGA